MVELVKSVIKVVRKQEILINCFSALRLLDCESYLYSKQRGNKYRALEYMGFK